MGTPSEQRNRPPFLPAIHLSLVPLASLPSHLDLAPPPPVSLKTSQQEDAWTVISAFFEDKGLVRQQLDSFNEFINSSMQEVVDECGEFSLRPNAQHAPGERAPAEDMEITVKFGQVYLSKPTMTEADGETAILFPKDARLRNLTYAAPLYVDVTKTVRKPREKNDGDDDGGAGDVDDDDKDGAGAAAAAERGLDVEVEEYPKVFMGEVPIMLRSDFCALSGLGSSDLSALGECPLDQGGYFVVNGSEKVLIAQERMAHNHVYVFRKPSPKYAFASECRSAPEGATRALSACAVRMLAKGGSGGTSGGGGVGAVLRAGLPYVKSDVPIMVVFRALGLTNDKEVLEHIVYDLGGDPEMLDALRPSIEEAFPVQSQETALDYIGKRAAAAGVARAERIAFARDILSRELLPHVGQGPAAETKKVKKEDLRGGGRVFILIFFFTFLFHLFDDLFSLTFFFSPCFLFFSFKTPHPPTQTTTPTSGLLPRLHGPSPPPRRPGAPRPRRPRSLRSQAPRPRRAPAGRPLPPALPQARQGRARGGAARSRPRARRQRVGRDQQGHGHAGAAVRDRDGQLGRARRRRRAGGRVAGFEQADFRFDAVAPQEDQLARREGREACQAEAAAQLAVGDDLPGGDARGAGVRVSWFFFSSFYV